MRHQRFVISVQIAHKTHVKCQSLTRNIGASTIVTAFFKNVKTLPKVTLRAAKFRQIMSSKDMAILVQWFSAFCPIIVWHQRC